MYLSALMIEIGANPDRPRPGRLWLRNLYRVHQRLCMAFPSPVQKADDPVFLQPYRPEGFQHVGAERTAAQAFLFRVDPLPAGRAMILVQSAAKPDWEYAFQNAPSFLAAPPQVKLFQPSFEPGQNLNFRLVANPTKKVGTIRKADREGLDPEERSHVPGRNGKRVPVPAREFEAWLVSHAVRSGFRVLRLESVQPGYVFVENGRDHSGCAAAPASPPTSLRHRLRSARYEGILTVEDTVAFARTLTAGLGPGKAFGFGLLSVAPCRSAATAAQA